MTDSNDLTLFGLPSESPEAGEKRVSVFKIKGAPINLDLNVCYQLLDIIPLLSDINDQLPGLSPIQGDHN